MSGLTKRKGVWLVMMLALVIALVAGPTSVAAHGGDTGQHATRQRVLGFDRQMHKLWEDHVVWTRMVIVSFAAGLPDYDAAVARLLQNQVDIGDAMKPFYGQAAGDQLTALLREHILLAADLLKAAKAGDTTAFNSAKARWYANADEIASFLHAANPNNWPLNDMQEMMRSHLDLTLQEASARLAGDWDADVAAYDAVHAEILEMADMLSEGIVKQFSGRFK